MIILGIDPGLATVGYGIIEVEQGRSRAICYDCIRTSGKNKDTPERLEIIYNGIAALIRDYAPSWVAVEKLFFTRNVTSAMTVSEVRGVILLAARQAGVQVAEYTPNQIKQAITGSGRADKKQMQEMIKRLLNLPGIPTPDDVADGLSVALCHIHVLR